MSLLRLPVSVGLDRPDRLSRLDAGLDDDWGLDNGDGLRLDYADPWSLETGPCWK